MRYFLIFLIITNFLPAYGRIEKKIPIEVSYHALEARLSLPAQVKNKIPAIILLGGFQTGEKSIDLIEQDLPMIYATIDYPYKAPEKRDFIRDMKEINKIKNAVHTTDQGIDRLVEYLFQNPLVDKNKIIIVGASFGAPFALSAAARHSEISGLIIIHGFGQVQDAIGQQLLLKWGSGFWNKIASKILGWIMWKYLAYPNPEDEALKLTSTQRVLFINSENDKQVPRASREALVSALKSSQAQIDYEMISGGHIQPSKKTQLHKIIEVCLAWVNKNFK